MPNRDRPGDTPFPSTYGVGVRPPSSPSITERPTKKDVELPPPWAIRMSDRFEQLALDVRTDMAAMNAKINIVEANVSEMDTRLRTNSGRPGSIADLDDHGDTLEDRLRRIEKKTKMIRPQSLSKTITAIVVLVATLAANQINNSLHKSSAPSPSNTIAP